MKRILILILALASISSFSQVPALNTIVRNNPPSSAKSANALDASNSFATSGTDTYSITVGLGQYAGGLTYASGDMFTITIGNANTSSTVTLNVDSEGAVALKNNDGTNPDIGSLCAGCTFKFRHNGTNFRMVGASVDGTVEDVTGTSPIVITGISTVTPNVTINNAAADGSTKGAASFTAADFNSSSGNISIDYANGQEATAGQDGFLSSTDWSTFNNKQSTGLSWLLASGGTLTGNNTIVQAGFNTTFTGIGTVKFSATSTVPGLHVGTLPGDPATRVQGDIWFNSSTASYRGRTASADLNLALSSVSSNQIAIGSAGVGAGGISGSVDLIWQTPTLLLGGVSPTANTRLDVRGTGTGTNISFRVADSGNTQKLKILDNGDFTLGDGTVASSLLYTSTTGIQISSRGLSLNGQTPAAQKIFGPIEIGTSSGNQVLSFVYATQGQTSSTTTIYKFNTSQSAAAGSANWINLHLEDVISTTAAQTGSIINHQLSFQWNSAFLPPNIIYSKITSVDGGQTGWNPSSGTNTLTGILLDYKINTGGGTQTATGLDYNPTLTAVTGLTHYAALFRTGFVGIGIAAPTYELNVKGTASNQNLFLVEEDGGTNAFEITEVSGANRMGFFAATPVIQQSVNTILVNNVTSGGSLSTIANFTDLTTYSNDAATIRNNFFRLSEKVLKLETALRNYGLSID